MTKAFWDGFWRGLSLGPLWCFLRRHHGPWRRPKGDESRYCRVCGTAIVVKNANRKLLTDRSEYAASPNFDVEEVEMSDTVKISYLTGVVEIADRCMASIRTGDETADMIIADLEKRLNKSADRVDLLTSALAAANKERES